MCITTQHLPSLRLGFFILMVFCCYSKSLNPLASIMNIQSPTLSPVTNSDLTNPHSATKTRDVVREPSNRRISDVEFVPADISDAAFQAQQLADQRQQQQQLSRESQQFMTLQQLDGDSRKGRFIDIQV